MTNQQPTPADPTTGNQQSPAVANTPDSTMIPKSRFDEVNNKAKDLEAKLAELGALEAKRKAEAEQAENDRLAKSQEWQTLAEKKQAEAEQLAPYKEKYEAIVTTTAERNKARVEALPEEKRTLVPDYDDPMKLAEWLDKNEKQLTEQKQTLGGGSPRTGRVNGKMPAQSPMKRSPLPSFSRL